MQHAELVVIKTFSGELAAEIAKSTLEAAGIDAMIHG
jgi:hypothetical protein